MVSTLAGAPESAAPIDAVAAALEAPADCSGSAGALRPTAPGGHRREHRAAGTRADQARVAVPRRSPTRLRERGVTEPAASLAAEAGIAVFKIAFERWIDEENHRDFPQLIRESLDELKVVTAGK